MPENLSGDDCFDAAADFIGRDWLNAQVEKFSDSPSHKTAPIPVKNFRRARKELGYVEDEFESLFPETSMPVLEFLNLGRYVLLLRESESVIVHPKSFEVLDTTLDEHFAPDLRTTDHYERTLYELQTGYFYARQGYRVQFLAEEQSESKTPDILLRTPNKIFVECKRVDAVSKDVQKAKSIAGELTERTARQLDQGQVAVFDYSSEPEMDDIGGVIGKIRSRTSKGPTTTELPFGKVTVFNLTDVFGDNGVWLVDDGSSIASDYEEVYETYLQPLVEKVVGQKLSLSEIEYSMKISRHESRGLVDYSELKFACVPTLFDRNRVDRVASQVDKARQKFGKEHPNILHIDTPFDPAIADEIVDDLRDAIGRRLGSTRRVTAVTISLPIKERGDAGAEAIRHQAASIRHTDPYTDLPDHFGVLGTDIT